MTTADFDPSHPHAICGTNALGARMGVGCGEPVFFDRPFPDDQHIAIRCADCMAVFCPLCARKHFDNSKRNFLELAMQYEKLKLLAREARSLIDTLNGNIQGQTGAEVRDPIAYAACQDMITRIDTLVGRTATST